MNLSKAKVMSESRLSVIIPVYNAERYLAEAIRSVLDQDYDDLEIVVVDDGSTDCSVEVAQRFKEIRLIRQANQGPGAGINTGISNARGTLIAFLDADDKWEPATLASRVARFDSDPRLDMTHGRVIEFASPELETPVLTADRAVANPVAARLGGTTMVKRTALERVGLLDTSLKLGAWMDWLMRAEEAGLVTEHHEDLVLHRRIHDDNLVSRESGSKGDYVRLLKRALDRRRETE